MAERDLDDRIGNPILGRHAEAMAQTREPAAIRRGYTCPTCGQPAFARYAFCVACLEHVPSSLRLLLAEEYEPGQERGGRIQPTAAWRAAYGEACQILHGLRGTA